MFVTAPRVTKRVDGTETELGRYSRLEHATPDPTWIAGARSRNGGTPAREALARWLRGDDGALEEWLGGAPVRRRAVRATA